MDANNSLLSLLLSRRFDPSATSGDPAFDSRQIFKVYVVRQINLLQWFSLVAITILLLKQLARAFDLRRKGNRTPGPPCQSFYGHLMLLAGANPQQYLTGYLNNKEATSSAIEEDGWLHTGDLVYFESLIMKDTCTYLIE